MKSDSQRQTEYQRRRLEKETRVVFWVSNDIDRAIRLLSRGENRSVWLRRAILHFIADRLAEPQAEGSLMEQPVLEVQRRVTDLLRHLPDQPPDVASRAAPRSSPSATGRAQ
jgi:hypothetical protein